MNNGWTGGQYSLFRVVLGCFLLARFAGLLHSLDLSPLAVMLAAVGISAASGLLVIGLYDRIAAALLCAVWSYFFAGDLSHPGPIYIALLLVIHVFMPAAPYGSWAARGRVDPGNHWRVPPLLYGIAWLLIAPGLSYSALAKVLDPSWPTLMFAMALTTLALASRFRPWVWMTLVALTALTELTSMLPLLLLFDPGWISPASAEPETIFYDGQCGLCHRSVRWILAEDRNGDAFRFAPLDSDKFRATVPEAQRANLPDSLVVHTGNGALLTRSAAVRHILLRLGGIWRLLGMLTRLVPAAILDRLYDGLARTRYRLFAKPTGLCPMMPRELRTRFDLW